jgi:hypothetical protein
MVILINGIGLLLIALIVWWFWLYKPGATKTAVELIVGLLTRSKQASCRLMVGLRSNRRP